MIEKRLAAVEAKKTPEQKAMDAAHHRKTKTGKGWRGTKMMRTGGRSTRKGRRRGIFDEGENRRTASRGKRRYVKRHKGTNKTGWEVMTKGYDPSMDGT